MANIQVRMNQVLRGETVYNVTYWQFPDVSALTLQEFADALRLSYLTNVESELNDNWAINSINIRQMDGGGAFTIEQSFTLGSLVGGNVSDLLPTQIALLIATAYTGSRPNRGRIYFAGMTEGSNNDVGEWDGAVLGSFETMVTEWKDGVTTTAGSCFLRIARPDFTLNTWTLDNPVENVIGRKIPATQRRRRVGVGI